MEQIAMTHPELPGSLAHAFPEAFEQVWKLKGWVITEEVLVGADGSIGDQPLAVNEGEVKAAKPDPENVDPDGDVDPSEPTKPANSNKFFSKDDSSQGEVGIDG